MVILKHITALIVTCKAELLSFQSKAELVLLSFRRRMTHSAGANAHGAVNPLFGADRAVTLLGNASITLCVRRYGCAQYAERERKCEQSLLSHVEKPPNLHLFLNRFSLHAQFVANLSHDLRGFHSQAREFLRQER
jgi:hypothetical protein